METSVVSYPNSPYTLTTLTNHFKERERLQRIFDMLFVITGEVLTNVTLAPKHTDNHFNIVTNLDVYPFLVIFRYGVMSQTRMDCWSLTCIVFVGHDQAHD